MIAPEFLSTPQPPQQDPEGGAAAGSAASGAGALPPMHLRTRLANMARNGQLSDIESWLGAMRESYPACAAYLHKIHDAVNQLDMDAIERLALAEAEGN